MNLEPDSVLIFKRELTRYGMEPFTTDPDAFRGKLQSLGVVGLRIKDIRLTGLNTTYIEPCLCRSLEEYKALPENWKPAIRRCFAETDPPLLIRLEDDRILSLSSVEDYEYGEVYYAELDAMQWEGQFDEWWDKRIDEWNPPNCNANVLFGKAIGMKIDGFQMNTAFCSNGEPYMTSYALELISAEPPFERLELTFECHFGYNWIALEKNGAVLELPEAQIPALFAGFEDWKDVF
ncbi:MAG: hypothetical protein IJK64_00640 [Clostridia bacterium]|nr:hypothetical protein [Clostridia bacterium]